MILDLGEQNCQCGLYGGSTIFFLILEVDFRVQIIRGAYILRGISIDINLSTKGDIEWLSCKHILPLMYGRRVAEMTLENKKNKNYIHCLVICSVVIRSFVFR